MKAFNVIQEKLTWEEAQERCVEMERRLATISTVEEQSQLLKFLKETYQATDSYWLGGKGMANNGWKWITGDAISTDGYRSYIHEGAKDKSSECLVLHPDLLSNGRYGYCHHKCTQQFMPICESEITEPVKATLS